MKLLLHTPVKSLNKAYLRQSLKRDQIELFKDNLKRMFERIRTDEHEEHLKNIVSDFLKDTWYKQTNEINTSGRTDLVIHNGKSSSDTVGVLMEVKHPGNNNEMISCEKPNVKALHELLHYYMQERYIKGNLEVRRLIVCNIHEWYIFDASDFERLFFHNKKFVENYQKWNDGLFSGDKTDWLYREILKPFVENELETLPCTYFDLRDYVSPLLTSPRWGEETCPLTQRGRAREGALIALYKVLSPPHLLKQSFANDTNSLNREFYSELLHIIGLEEVKEKGKKLINRKAPERRDEASLLENTLNILKVRNKLTSFDNPEQTGANEDEQYFSLGLELCITWLNRILFLKLLEGQLRAYHRGNREYAFLNTRRIADFDELEELFFEVLARRNNDRAASVKEKFGDIPYLNSSLFEESDLERKTLHIAALKGRLDLELHGSTVLKNAAGKRLNGKKNTLQYLFEFLDAYDFSSEGEAEIQETPRTIINASVLGLIFEKINGYRDGSFYTPGFITMYICRETIRRAVVERFNSHFLPRPQGEGRGEGGVARLPFKDFDDLRDKLDSSDREVRKQANAVINSLTVCDPAVGSGHFLVSALNELVAIKSELGILCYRDNGDKIKEYKIIVENDELIVTDKDDDSLFAYTLNRNNRPIDELQRLHETLFHEKETLIENCLFGVDINPKSVAICRLRLWIELLKNAYYTVESGYAELETLPNIDINIKCGNSLVSRFGLGNNVNLPAASQNKLKELTEKYRRHVFEYKLSPANKAQLRKVIDGLKHDLENFGLPNDKDLIALRKKENEVAQLGFAFDKKGTETRQKLLAEVEIMQKRFAEKERLVYSNSFEWRFEFPEVLDENGEYIGFDAVIGNPPYIRQEAIKEQKPAFLEMFGSFYCGTADIYTYFYKTGLNLLKAGATLCYIAPNKFMRAGYGKNTRELLTTLAKPLMVLDFGDLPIFDEATTYPSIVMVEKMPTSQPPPSGGRSKKNTLPQRGRAGEGEPLTSPPEHKLFVPTPVPLPLLEAARALRGNMTDAEQLLWHCLRRKQLDGYRFRRQHPFERYVLDFYCCEAKLAVELDGGQHNEPDARTRDNERTVFLEQHGIHVIRFWNNEVFSNIEGALETIYLELQRNRPLPNPPPPGEGILGSPGQGDGTLGSSVQGDVTLNSSPQRGEAGRGVFFTATFTDTAQLTRFDETLATIGFTMPVAALRNEGWTLERPDVLALMNKLRKVGKPLGEYVEGKIFYGIKTGLNEAFVIDEETKARLIAEDPRSAEIIKPWLRGKDIFRWKTKWAELYIIALASSANWKWPWSQEQEESMARSIFEIEYPAIHRHLSQWEEGLRKRDDQGRYWWELRSCVYYCEFEKPKILWPGISADLSVFSLDENGYFGNDNNQLIISGDQCLLAILNSKLICFVLSHLCDRVQGGFYRLKIIYMNQLPIPPATNAHKAPIIERVQKILAAPDSPDVPQLEAEIDRLVYALYDLTDAEIALVEGKA